MDLKGKPKRTPTATAPGCAAVAAAVSRYGPAVTFLQRSLSRNPVPFVISADYLTMFVFLPGNLWHFAPRTGGLFLQGPESGPALAFLLVGVAIP